jgi:hypothetical protein
MARGEDAASFDEWAPSGIGSAAEICEIFTQRFYFGCEGDDPLNALASETKGSPFDAKLHALYGSDLGHWDVPEMAQAAQEAHELVEHGVISEDAFRDMVFTNAVEFWTSGNRGFLQRYGGAGGRGFIVGKRLLETAVVGVEPDRGLRFPFSM